MGQFKLRARKEHKKKAREQKRAGGLAPKARFLAVQRDLERLRRSWGGLVPEGVRNVWLHLYATCLTHTSEAPEVAQLVEQMAAQATPGLPTAEVVAVAKLASRQAALPTATNLSKDGRYHYSGARIAELLGVTAEGARALGLEQIMPEEERAKRKAKRERERRRAAGSVSREDWLRENGRERQKPWTELGISKSTYYRHLKTG